MKHLFFTLFLVPPVIGLAQKPMDIPTPASMRNIQTVSRETFANNSSERRNDALAEPRAFHDWKQTIAENNSVLASRVSEERLQPAPVASASAANNKGSNTGPRRYFADPDGMYYYSGTPYTWGRSHDRKKDSNYYFGHLKPSDLCYTGDPAFQLAACMSYINFYTPLPNVNDIHYRYNSAYAHDGYIVYKGDTIPGVITFGHDRVTIENVDARGQQKTCISLLDNLLLRDIVVYTELRELHMRRPTKNDTRLWRQLHHGKLNIYDKRYSFISSKNIDTRGLRIQYGNGALHRVRSKGQLVSAINRSYQLKLKSDKYSWKELFDLIATLG